MKLTGEQSVWVFNKNATLNKDIRPFTFAMFLQGVKGGALDGISYEDIVLVTTEAEAQTIFQERTLTSKVNEAMQNMTADELKRMAEHASYLKHMRPQ